MIVSSLNGLAQKIGYKYFILRMALETRIYQKESSLSFFKLLTQSLRDIYSSRFLSKQLAKRDITAQYRQSYLGVLWAFVTPLMTALVWVVLRQTGTVKLSDTGIPYPVYVFAGTLIWSILVEAINSPMNSTNAARSILTKINFPKEALVVSGIYKLLFNSFIKLLLLVLFVVFYKMGFHWSMLLFPFSVLGAVLFGTSIGLLFTPIGLLYKDIGKIITFGLQFLMYATPVVYAIPKEGMLKELIELNPLTPLILVPRNLLTSYHPDHLIAYMWVVGLSFPLFFLGLVLYRSSIPIIVERLTS